MMRMKVGSNPTVYESESRRQCLMRGVINTPSSWLVFFWLPITGQSLRFGDLGIVICLAGASRASANLPSPRAADRFYHMWGE
jgi:hypothetical protein